jgi:hypothetical protein
MQEIASLVLLANACSTLMLIGLIWFVQIVHYPLFRQVGAEQFPGYHAAHVRLITWVVAPAMIIEAVTAAIMAWQPPLFGGELICRAALILVLVIWLSTALMQVPRHDVLAQGFDAVAHGGLVWTNWTRTVAWSLRGVVVVYLLYRAMG